MAEVVEKTETALDRSQVKKAIQALQAFLKTKATGDSLLLDESQAISLLFTLWKVPKQPQTIRIPLPHGQRSDTDEVCLFTRDEPNMTSEQTQRFYKKLLEERGVSNVSEIIPYKVLKTEYKPYEAKRRLLGNFDMFLSDDRIRRLLPSQLGRHFYDRKREPLSVNLQSKHLARDIQGVIQGTNMKITNKGCCCMARVGHPGMTADEVAANIEAAVLTVEAKLRMKGPVIKLIHVKSQTSVALPIYTADLSQLSVLKKNGLTRKSKEGKKKTQETKQADTPADIEAEEKKKKTKVKKNKAQIKKEEEEEEEEEIPQLVPIETPIKKPKLEKQLKKKPLEKAPKPGAKKETKAQSKLTKKAAKTDSKKRRKVPKVK